MTLTSGRLAALTELADDWSFLWDKRRQPWIAAEDSPDGVQFEEDDLSARRHWQGHDGVMHYPGPDDPELLAAVMRYVDSESGTRAGRYLKLLHGNALNMSGTDRTEFESALGRDARQITDRELGTLLDSEWRSRLTAAWLIGLDRRTHFRDRLGEMLLDSELVYAGQGYCLALARFETVADADVLCAYLDRSLPLDRPFDADWAIGALLHLDERLGSNRADRFLAPGGPWEKSAASRHDPAEWHLDITRLCAYADECMRAGELRRF